MPQSTNTHSHTVVAKRYRHLSWTLHGVENAFNKCQQPLHNGRNVLKNIVMNDQNTIVKAFKVPHPIQGMIYKFLRKSKSRRSFEHGLKLLSKGINTPQPIAYLEVHSDGGYNKATSLLRKLALISRCVMSLKIEHRTN